jgi:glycosyltransferase involved in cell wall biosynthesis
LFAAYKELRPGPLRLVFAGPVVEPLPAHPEIDVLGPVSEEEKWSLLTGATAVVSPSAWEAFSLVIVEAWSARTPVLVNAACAATVEHCRRSAAGLSFSDFGEFAAIVDRLVGDPATAFLLGARGRSYVDKWFRWPQIIDRYAAFIETTVDSMVASDA